MKMTSPRFWRAIAAMAAVTAASLAAAQVGPVNGMRPADIRIDAITGATVVVAPGQTMENATIVMRDGVIIDVGSTIEAPASARIWSGEGLTVYPGLIDAAVLVRPTKPPAPAGAHWSERVTPQISMTEQPGLDEAIARELRSLGFAAAAVYPEGGVLAGSGVVVALADESEHALAYRERAAMAAAFDYGGRWESASYPGSLMGAIALIRQTLLDARWHAECTRIWREHPAGHEPPLRADALAALGDVISRRQAVIFDVTDEANALRAAAIAEELELDAMLLGSGFEFRRLDEIVATKLPVIVPLRYPDRPSVSSIRDADRITLREMQTWEQAPTNARRLLDAGATMALTTHRLKKRSEFPAALHKTIQHGLSEDAALAALTTTPAKLLGLDHVLGTIERGKAANLVVVEGSLFEKKPTIRETWVNGRRYEVKPKDAVQLAGAGALRTTAGQDFEIELDTTKPSLSITPPSIAEPEGDGEEDAQPAAKPKPVKAKDLVVQQERISFVLDGEPFEADGFVRMTGVISGGEIAGTGVLPDGSVFEFTIEEIERGDAEDAEKEAEGETDVADDEQTESEMPPPPDELVHPLGAYGLAEPPQREDVLLINATIWTAGPDGIIENGWMLVRDGKIAAIGAGPAPQAPGLKPQAIPGKHITPGLIDCHSHTGIDGSVNEWTQVNTAEVRIGDVIDPDDINWYRQLAGGLTACNQLHGSANPIGGQNSVVKLKWGRGASEFPVVGAIPGIKFALGENVVRSRQRYPNTRMGVETVIRDAFAAARHDQDEWDRYNALSSEERSRTMPPRRDLELEALAEILRGQRIIHCHSYRQDEILMLIRLAEEFGFTIGTFQHVLEGYKVAEAIASHGAGASSFSDWWAYKVEVMDAVPHNGSLMHEVGVLVSFNSDSSELARRMNLEAAKAVRYGGTDSHEALKFVTINPAKQLRIDDRTGSLEVGKDADFVIWSGHPLSTATRCEQTWIEGARHFDLETDLALRAEAERERHRLTQKILAEAHKSKGNKPRDDSPAPDATKEEAPTHLLARMLDARRRWMEERIARGEDPDEIQPGDCGGMELRFSTFDR